VEEYVPMILKIGALLLLAFALLMARLNSKSVLDTIAVAAHEIPGKRLLLKQAQWDFNILFAAVLIITAGLLELVEKQTFVTFLTAALAALGVKSVSELKGTSSGSDKGA